MHFFGLSLNSISTPFVTGMCEMKGIWELDQCLWQHIVLRNSNALQYTLPGGEKRSWVDGWRKVAISCNLSSVNKDFLSFNGSSKLFFFVFPIHIMLIKEALGLEKHFTIGNWFLFSLLLVVCCEYCRKTELFTLIISTLIYYSSLQMSILIYLFLHCILKVIGKKKIHILKCPVSKFYIKINNFC